VAGFHAWLKLRRCVRKGEKGIVILAPMVGRKHTSQDEELTEDSQSRLFGFRAAHVFDVSQTDGEALPEFAKVTGDPQGYAERLKEFVLSQHIALEYDARIRPAQGMSSGGKITLLPDLHAPSISRSWSTKPPTKCSTGMSAATPPCTASVKPRRKL
jgi:hypothetical protein